MKIANDALAQAFGIKAQKASHTLTMGTPELRAAIMAELRKSAHGFGAETLARRLGGLDVLSIRRRLSELHTAGKIKQTGNYQPTAMGRKEALWEIA